MSEKSNPAFEKARDEAIRVLVLRGGLKPALVAALKLNQLQLAKGLLVVEPDEFEKGEEAVRLKLDAAMQRAMIDWLVVRPDSSNDHLFPGSGQDALDVATIERAVADKQRAVPPKSTAEAAPPPKPAPPGRETPVAPPPEPLPPRRARPGDREAAPSPPPPGSLPEEPQAVPLDEIEALRQRLARAYDAREPAARETRQPQPPPAPAPREKPAEAASERRELPPQRVEETLRPARPAPGRPERKPEPGRPVPPARVEPREPVAPKPETEATPAEGEAAEPGPPLSERLRSLWKSGASQVTMSYRTLIVGGAALLLVVCCVGLVAAGGTLFSAGGPGGLLAAATPTETATPTSAATSTSTPEPTNPPTPTQAPSATPTPSPALTDTPAPTPTPVVIVVTATPSPEPSPTETPEATNTPAGGARPAQPTATPTPGFVYPAPALLQPRDGGKVPGRINYLHWEPVDDLAENEWYAVRLFFRQAGQPQYEGDRTKAPEWLVPERFYYAADGPDLQYEWYVYVERVNPDGSVTPLSPESKHFVFRWE